MSDLPLNVLLVEDEEAHAELIRRGIEAGGGDITVTVAGSLREARERLSESAPSLMIVDYLLPDGRGLDLLPGAEGEPSLPVLILTSHGNEQVAVEAIKAGALDYVVKTESTLLAMAPIVKRALREWRHITARRRAESAHRESEARYSSMFEKSDAAMLLIDPVTDAIVDANPAAVSFYGWSREELVRKTTADLLAIAPRQSKWASVSADRRHFFSRHRLAGGEERHVEIYSSPLAVGERRFLFTIIHDVTERRRRERELAAIASIARSLRPAGNRQEMLPTVMNSVFSLLQAEAAAILFLDQATNELVLEVARGKWEKAVGRRFAPAACGIWQTLESGRPYHSQKRDAIPLAPDEILTGTSSSVSIPLTIEEHHHPLQRIGVLCLGRNRKISERELHLLASVVDIAASAIHRATLFEQTESRLQRLYTLRNIDLAITGSLDRRLTLDIVLENIMAQLRVDAAAVLLFRAPPGLLEYAAGRGFRSHLIKQTRLGLGEGSGGRAAYERKLVRIPDLSEAGDLFLRRDLVASESFVSYFGVPLIARGEIKGVLEIFHRTPLHPDPEWLEFLESLGIQTAIAIDTTALIESLQRSNSDLLLAYDITIEGWSKALDLRDKETEGHSLRVTDMTIRLAQEMRVPDEELIHVRRGALLHDIGKMGVPDAILFKPGKLSEEEWAIMKKHPVFAHDLLSPIHYLRHALDIPYCHHEKWDGSGYPRGLKGEMIPQAARIFAVIDVWDALNSDRPYRPAWPREKTLAYLREEAGKHFDPAVVDAFLRMDL